MSIYEITTDKGIYEIETQDAKVQIKDKPSFRSEIIGPITHAASALAFDVPRASLQGQVESGVPGAAQAKEFLYPEQKTFGGKLLRGALEVPATVLGGAGRWAGKVFTKAAPIAARTGLFGRAVQGAATGATYEAATAKADIEKYGEGIKTGALTGGILPVAGRASGLLGKGASEAGKFISKNFGGVTEATRNTIKRLGANRVFDPLKEKADYVGKVLTPRVIEKVRSFDEDIKNSLEKHFKVPKNIIQNLTNAGVKNIEELRLKADDSYGKAFDKSKVEFIGLNQTYNKIGGVLKKYGFIDLQGKPTSRVESFKDSPYKRLNDIYQDMRRSLLSPGEKIATGIVPKNDFILFRDQINKLYKDVPSDRDVYSILNGLYDDAEKSGIKGINAARSLQRQAFEAESSNLGKAISDLSDPIKLDRTLSSLGNPKNYNLREAYKGLIGKDNYDDLEAHFANRDFNLVTDIPGVGGGVYPSRAGFLRTGISGATKKYYKDFKPGILSGKRLLGKTKEKVSEFYSRPLLKGAKP